MITIKTLKVGFYLSVFMTAITLVFMVPSLILMMAKSQWNDLFSFLAMFITVMAVYGFMIYKTKFVYKLKGINVFDDHFELEYTQQKKKIYYKDILKIKILNKMIGSYQIFTPKGSFKIGPNLFEMNKISYLTEAIFLSRPDVLSPEDFSEVRAQNFYFKDVHYKNGLLIQFMPFVFIYGVYLFHSQSFYTLDYFAYIGSAFLVFLVPLLLLIATVERWLTKKTTSAIVDKINTGSLGSDDIKNLKLRKIKLAAFVYAFSLPYFVLVYKYDLNFLDYNGTYWIDERYGKNEEKYKLEKNHHVYYRDDHDGIVIALPGESVAVNFQKGRKLASEQLVQVPPHEYGIRSGETVLLVKDKQISGKVIPNLQDFFKF